MDLDLASHAAGSGDPERAMTLVYEAGLRACIAILAKAGYRLRSGEGHHRAALEAAVAVVGDQIEIGISRLDDARRRRNQSLYGIGRPAGAYRLRRLTADVKGLKARPTACKRVSQLPRRRCLLGLLLVRRDHLLRDV